LFLVDAGLTTYFFNRAARETLNHIKWMRAEEGHPLEFPDPRLKNKLRRLLARFPGPEYPPVRFLNGLWTIEVNAVAVRAPLSELYTITLGRPRGNPVSRARLSSAF
jgi:hypothetical protein